MRARDFTFVRNGPDCVCSHARVDHVGVHPRYKVEVWDDTCQVEGCTGCEKYKPLGPLSVSTLRWTDIELQAADHLREREELRRLRVGGLVAMAVGAFLGICASGAKQAGFEWLVIVLSVVSLAALVASAVCMVVAVHRLEPPHLLLDLTSLLPLPILVLATLAVMLPIPSGVVAGSALLLVPIALVLMGVETRRVKLTFRKTTGAMMEDVDELLASTSDRKASMGDERSDPGMT